MVEWPWGFFVDNKQTYMLNFYAQELLTQTYMLSIVMVVERARDFSGKERQEWRKEIYRDKPLSTQDNKETKGGENH